MKRKISFFEKILGKNGEDEEENLKKLDLEEKDMIKGVVKLSETTVKEVMVPRIDVVLLPIDVSTDELLKTMAECGHSRVPIYRETIDDIVGILYAKDLLRYLIENNRETKSEEINLEKLMRTPYFVPESKRIDSLLKEFKRRKVHIAIVVDEYGGTSGIVCLEDIIEEIVGDIQDEFDNEVEEIVKISDNTYVCDARVNIEDLNAKLNLNLPEENFDTLGGFVFDLLGKIPVKYEKVKYKNIDFIINNMEGHKIGTVKIIVNAEE